MRLFLKNMVIGCGLFGSSLSLASAPVPLTSLMTMIDAEQNNTANLSIVNGTSQNITSYGLFITSFDVNDCSSCFGAVVSGDNVGGAMVQPIRFNAGQSLPVGKNFLYNLMYNGIYYIKNTVGSSPCSLPGCSWPGDDPSVHGWCVSINVISAHSSYTSSTYQNGSNPPANVPAYSAAGNSTPFNYKYDLINPNTLGTGSACIGPITCNDETLTCQLSTPQREVFQAYA